MFSVEAVDPSRRVVIDALADVQHRANPHDYDVPYTADELSVLLLGDEFEERVSFAAFEERAMIGAAVVQFPLRDNPEVGYVEIDVVPERQRRGVGTALLDLVTRAAHDRGRTLLLAEPSRDLDDATSPGHEFALARGFIDDTVIAVRSQPLGHEWPERSEPRDGYRLDSWVGPAPGELENDYARLRALLNQEAPSGVVELQNEYWDPSRLHQELEQNRHMGREMVTVVAISPENLLVGHTQLVIPTGTPDVLQWDTLVLPEHRGHGLGLALKAEALHVAKPLIAGRSRVVTWNDASNSPMIAVNEALGYRQIGWLDQVARVLTTR